MTTNQRQMVDITNFTDYQKLQIRTLVLKFTIDNWLNGVSLALNKVMPSIKNGLNMIVKNLECETCGMKHNSLENYLNHYTKHPDHHINHEK